MALVLVAALFFPHEAVAAIKSGQMCKKVGQIASDNGKKFICIKSGKKNIWKALPSPKPSTLVANPTPQPEKTVEPTIEFTSTADAKLNTACLFSGSHVALLEGPAACVERDGKKWWSLIPRENDSVASRAYRFVLEKYVAAPEGNLSLDFRIDPNTPEWSKKIEKGMYAVARFWGTSPNGSAALPILISADLKWWPAQLDAVKDPGKEDYLKRLATSTCQAGFHGGPNPFFSFAFQETKCVTNVGFKQVPAHEYTHYAQAVLMDSLGKAKPRVPWMEEGLASFIGGALGPMSDMGNDLRFGWSSDLRGNQVPLDFFSRDERSVYDSQQWGDIYPVGAIAVEGLVALVGIDGVLKYYESIKSGSSTDQAMKNSFGLSVSSAANLLEGYVKSVRAKSDWTLSRLESEWASAKSS